MVQYREYWDAIRTSIYEPAVAAAAAAAAIKRNEDGPVVPPDTRQQPRQPRQHSTQHPLPLIVTHFSYNWDSTFPARLFRALLEQPVSRHQLNPNPYL
jgi:hypothetical protein